MTKVKIKSDGTAPGTRIIVDGVELTTKVTEVRWNLKANGMAEVTLKMTDVSLDVDGQMAMRFEGPGHPGVYEITQEPSPTLGVVAVGLGAPTVSDLLPKCRCPVPLVDDQRPGYCYECLLERP